MELTDNDRQRIEQTAFELYDKWREPEEYQACINGAEYATLYERQRSSDYALELLEDLYRENVNEVKELKAERSDLLAKVSEQEKEIERLRDALEKIDGYAKNVRPLKVIHDIITEAIL